MSISMDIMPIMDREDVSLQVEYRRKLADNASEIHYYEDRLEKIRSLPKIVKSDIEDIVNTIDSLYDAREQLSAKYMKALRENK